MGFLQKKLLSRLTKGETIDLRADGKAGSGLVMILQAFAEAVSLEGTYQVQEWPLFSSARKGANVRGFLRIAKGEIQMTCQIERPHVALLLSEKTGEELDFASGLSEGMFVVNSERSPEETATFFRLSGEIYTIAANRLGLEYLGHSIPNISVLAALHKALPLVSDDTMKTAIRHINEKRRLPEKIIQANERCFTASLQEVQDRELVRKELDHPLPVFDRYEDYPTAAQSRLRTSFSNKTANYARAGRRLVFRDPTDRCTGCSLCIVNCPEGIIRFEPDPKRGVRVTGADTNQFCKLCRECIEVCPVDLFDEVGIEALT
ncbi:MAG: 2-oxoacid:acceptor oxidoreductase family protein [Deltaproteobacteria bacterium]|nr:2-oxoacid:acceptor oxidoreductase family protein [Deltaproteobacteria bacterium]